MLRTAAESDSLQAPGKIAARGRQGNLALASFNPKWKARTRAEYFSTGHEPLLIENDVCTYITGTVPGAFDFATGLELLYSELRSVGSGVVCIASD